jgi:hypothetical protein
MSEHPQSTTDGGERSDFCVDSNYYACRCGAVVQWRATPDGLVIVDHLGQPHKERCPLRGEPRPTPRDLYYRRHAPVVSTPQVVVKVANDVPQRVLDKITDALAEIPLAIDETRQLSQTIARYAARVDQRASSPRAATPPATTTGEPTRGASVVRTTPRVGADPGPAT